jgi:hypothetical protein
MIHDEHSLADRLGKARLFIWYSLVRVPWLCGYNLIGALLLVILFAFNDQGLDLLRISAARPLMDAHSPWNLLFIVGTALLSLSMWYSSRLLLGRKFPTYELDPDASAFGRKWLPRLLGSVVPLAIAVGYYRAQGGFSPLAEIFLGMGLGLLLFYILRRMLLPDPQLMLEHLRAELRIGDLLLVLVFGLATFALLVAFMVRPVWLPQYVGAPAIAVVAVGGIALFGSMVLTYWFLAQGSPAATTLALVLALLFGLVNDNHDVRLARALSPLERVAPAEHYAAWRARHPVPAASTIREPVVLVAASGGGIRAAYWTASALAAMESVWGPRPMWRSSGRSWTRESPRTCWVVHGPCWRTTFSRRWSRGCCFRTSPSGSSRSRCAGRIVNAFWKSHGRTPSAQPRIPSPGPLPHSMRLPGETGCRASRRLQRHGRSVGQGLLHPAGQAERCGRDERALHLREPRGDPLAPGR